jgi:hypothetical protein
MVCSVCLRGYVEEFRLIEDVPWGPHEGVRLILNRKIRAATRALGRARPKPLWDDTSVKIKEITWEEAKVEALREMEAGEGQGGSSLKPHEADDAVKRAAASMGMSKEATELGTE